MKEQDILHQFHQMAEALNDNPYIEIVTCDFNPPATKEELDQVQSKFKLTPAMIDFYSQVNGINILWESQESEIMGEGEASGYINLLSVQEVFKDWKNIIYYKDDHPASLLHPIDFFVGNACAGLYMDGSENPEVYHCYTGGKMTSLGVDFEGYLQLLLKSRGFRYWYSSIILPKYDKPELSMRIAEREFREIMPELFSDFNLSDFQRLSDK